MKLGQARPLSCSTLCSMCVKVKGVLLKWGCLECQQGANGVIMGKTMGTVPRDSPVCTTCLSCRLFPLRRTLKQPLSW